MLETLTTPEFWIALGLIVWVNIILSGDNAVVIALAARSLPPHQQKRAIFWGAGAAVALRIVLTIAAVKLLEFAFLKLLGGVALLWIAVKLLVPEEEGGGEVEARGQLWGAVKTILVADLVMSTDNVIAVAAAAKGSLLLLALGLIISIPTVIFGATLLMTLMQRVPIIITLGAAVLGWTSGAMVVTDPAVLEWVTQSAPWLDWGGPAIGALAVLATGKALARRRQGKAEVTVATPSGPPRT